MQSPSLFEFATSELSQDAFICWLASWADPKHAEAGPLHQTAVEFLDRLLEVGGVLRPLAYASVEVKQQKYRVDVLLLINEDIAVIIEDKVNSSEHSHQLATYARLIQANLPERDKLARVYFKSGEQCSIQAVFEAGYGLFDRGAFLRVLKHGREMGVNNDIFADFHNHLLKLDSDIRSFAHAAISDWTGRQWQGFYSAIKAQIPEADWAPRAGGEPTFRWHSRESKYLRLKGKELAFCIRVAEEKDRRKLHDSWFEALLDAGLSSELELKSGPLRLGERMTVATLVDDYRETDGVGHLSLDRTVRVMRQAENLMDLAMRTIAQRIDPLLPFLRSESGSESKIEEVLSALYSNGWILQKSHPVLAPDFKVENETVESIRVFLTRTVRAARHSDGRIEWEQIEPCLQRLEQIRHGLDEES